MNLKVSDLERSIAFYSEVLGLVLRQRYGNGGAFLGAAGYHHHVGLNTVSQGGVAPPEECTGLHHVAFVYPNRRSLATAVRRPVLDAGITLVHNAHHGVSEAVYFRDADGAISLRVGPNKSQWRSGRRK